VCTAFIVILVGGKLNGDARKDFRTFTLLNEIMCLTTRELEKTHIHLW
jgi:hypothetical protein